MYTAFSPMNAFIFFRESVSFFLHNENGTLLIGSSSPPSLLTVSLSEKADKVSFFIEWLPPRHWWHPVVVLFSFPCLFSRLSFWAAGQSSPFEKYNRMRRGDIIHAGLLQSSDLSLPVSLLASSSVSGTFLLHILSCREGHLRLMYLVSSCRVTFRSGSLSLSLSRSSSLVFYLCFYLANKTPEQEYHWVYVRVVICYWLWRPTHRHAI